MPYLELKAVSKRYRDQRTQRRSKQTFTTVLEDISFSIEQHEKVVFVGPSGCGKSTLLELICQLKQPETGNIHSPPAAFMPQQNSLLPWLTAVDNAALPLRIYGTNRQAARRQAKDLFKALQLEDACTRKPHQLSGGMRQRVAFARTLLTDRAVLCLDEPFAALDALARTALQQWLIDALTKTPRTMLMVTHDTEEAVLLADRVFVFSNKPSHIIGEVRVDSDHPRTATDPAVVANRAKILALLEANTNWNRHA